MSCEPCVGTPPPSRRLCLRAERVETSPHYSSGLAARGGCVLSSDTSLAPRALDFAVPQVFANLDDEFVRSFGSPLDAKLEVLGTYCEKAIKPEAKPEDN